MTKEQHRRLRHAFIEADNAFHAALKKNGFYASYGLNSPHDGSVYDAQDNSVQKRPVASLKIEWKLAKADEN